MSGVKGKSGRKSKAWHAAEAARKALEGGATAAELARIVSAAAAPAKKATPKSTVAAAEVAAATGPAIDMPDKGEEGGAAVVDVGVGIRDSREFLEEVMASGAVDIRLRVRAAGTLAQYQHVRTRDGGKKETQAERAAAVVNGEGRGKYAPAAPPRAFGVVKGGKG